MTEGSVKKVVSRNVAIALGIVCIVLGVILFDVFAMHTSAINSKSDLEGKISSRDDESNTLNAQVSFLQGRVDTLNRTLNQQKQNLTEIINLAKSKVWIDHNTLNQPENYYSYWNFTAGCSGYAIAGATSSFGAGGYDFWLVKTDQNGEIPEPQPKQNPAPSLSPILIASAAILLITIPTAVIMIIRRKKARRGPL